MEFEPRKDFFLTKAQQKEITDIYNHLKLMFEWGCLEPKNPTDITDDNEWREVQFRVKDYYFYLMHNKEENTDQISTEVLVIDPKETNYPKYFTIGYLNKAGI